MASEPSTLHTRPSLLFRLRNWEDAGSWEEFYELYRRLVYGFARKAGLAHEEAEEVCQDVFARVAKTIHEFESNPEHGSFRGWLMNLTRWRVADKFRERQAAGRLPMNRPTEEDDGTRMIERIPDQAGGDAGWEQEWRGHVLDAAMARVARQTKAKHFQVFELYSRQHWPVLRIARELDLNPAAVYLINHRLTKRLRTEVSLLEKVLA